MGGWDGLELFTAAVFLSFTSGSAGSNNPLVAISCFEKGLLKQ